VLIYVFNILLVKKYLDKKKSPNGIVLSELYLTDLLPMVATIEKKFGKETYTFTFVLSFLEYIHVNTFTFTFTFNTIK